MGEQRFPAGILPVLPVDDVDATTEFYVEKLQFDEHFRQGEPGADPVNAQVGFEGSTLMLNLNPDHAALEGGGVYFWIRLYDRDIDEYYEALREEGVTVTEAIDDRFWGDRSFTIRDCNGYSIAFNKALAAG